jgi:nucleotide-binding universal stress UspA family protein/post-segregation antitoxin (ccd killing protein)
MTFKTILTVATNPDRAGALFDAAARLAMSHKAHLDALALGIDPTQMAYAYLGSGEVLLQITHDRAIKTSKAIETALQAAAKHHPEDLRWSCESALALQGGVTDAVAQRARFADLVVLERPYGPDRLSEDEVVVEAALFSASAPVLILPEAPIKGAIGSRVVLAWNQTNEGLRAARAALPFLQKASLVSVTMVDPPHYGIEGSDPGGALCQMLARHGVKAEISVLSRSLPSVSDVIARHVLEFGADLLVMGAYGHSRLREALVGGVTRRMLEAAKVPVLMSH